MIVGIIVNKFIIKKECYRNITLGILGAIFISLIFNILGISYKTFSLSNIFIAGIGAFIAIYFAKEK